MTCIFRPHRFFTLFALAVAVAVPQLANAQIVKPFKIVGVGVAPEGLGLPGEEARPNDIVGNATHLGRHTGDGSTEIVTAEFISTGLVGTFRSSDAFVFVGSNGDKLICDYGQDEDGNAVGTYVVTVVDVVGAELLVEAFFIAEFVPRPDESTGKFSGVTGSWTMFAQTETFILGSDDPFVYEWEGNGKLTFRKGGRKK
jgi:hypothetical protein